MDFGYTDDQREIQRTARDLLADRASPERVREHAEAGRHDDGLWKELSELGWPGIAVAEEHGGQGLGTVELAILSEELGRTVAPVPFLPSAMAAAIIAHAGSDEQRARWLPGLASGELVGAVGTAQDGVAGLVPSGADAGVVVLVEGDGMRVLARAEAEVEPLQAIDPTRPAARITASPGAGEALPGDTDAGLQRALVALSAELVGVCEPRAGHDRGLRQGAQAVRHAGRAPSRPSRTAARRCCWRPRRPRDHGLRGVDGGRRAPAPGRGRGAWPRRRRPTPAAGDRERDPGPRRHRLHLGGRRALALQARAGRRGAAGRGQASTAPGWRASSASEPR